MIRKGQTKNHVWVNGFLKLIWILNLKVGFGENYFVHAVFRFVPKNLQLIPNIFDMILNRYEEC